ncbi:hypothetical protein BC940DRAFT_300718 [Gongronella butleri]|nr:hypothetical protein BC940DRAFT_312637 [Gongronella butleri]KAI8060275.1 hypothetical protein BC940DRAFT_312349 [Gongronella butleri]KAI8061614.1 hypothetical protein BC940DRAFT_310257 [Gongronella butleri]KAI8061802.1 hypothetical protein BC940DRAFT_309733 [Gongronella butleri]KAI8063635.1 hypothetical protein BC940DRAFT_307107 [Gongronella butleri]
MREWLINWARRQQRCGGGKTAYFKSVFRLFFLLLCLDMMGSRIKARLNRLLLTKNVSRGTFLFTMNAHSDMLPTPIVTCTKRKKRPSHGHWTRPWPCRAL